MNTDRDEKGKFAPGNKAGTLFRTDGEQSEIARQGGIASGEARREKKRWKDLLEKLLDLPINIKMPDKTEKKTTMSEAILIGQIRAAMAGKTEAAKFLAQLTGDLVEKKEIDLSGKIKTQDESFDGLPEDVKLDIVRKIQDAKHKKYMHDHYGDEFETDTTA